MKININLSIKRLTLIIIILAYSSFFLITSFNLQSYADYEFTRTEKLIKNFNTTLSEQIVEKVNNISSVSKYPLLLPEMNTLNSILSSNDSYDINSYNYLQNLCQMMLIQSDSINGAYIYDLKGRGVYSTRNSSYSTLKNPSLEKWFIDSLSSNDTSSIFTNINSNNIFETPSLSSELLLGFTRQIIDSKTQQVMGLILLTAPMDDFIHLLENDLPYTNQVVELHDISGEVILSTTNEEITDLSSNSITSFNYYPETIYINQDKSYIVTYNVIQKTNWVIYNIIPKDSVNDINNLYYILFIINLIFGLILFVIIYIFLLNRIFKPLNYLVANMSANIETNLSTNINYTRNDEIGILITSYNEMKNRLNTLININYKNQIEQKELELKQLQTQINPHFIYNTLESIHMMAEINDDLETSTMAEYFGSIIRYSMNRKINTVLLKDEMNIIDNYIYLQRIRFDQLFTIENLIPQDVLNCEIIKMIIQPLIENSIYHGLSECSGNGKIIIQGEHLNNNLILTISDNGIGIDEPRLIDLNDYINDKNNKFKGVALRNINRRLKLNYGEEYGLEIFSALGFGTSMRLTIPYIIKELV